MSELFFQDIKVFWDETRLVFSNSRYSRTYSLETPLWHTLEMKDASGRLFAGETVAAAEADLNSYTYNSQFKKWHLKTVNASVMTGQPFESDHVLITLRYIDDYSHSLLTREFFLYPGLAMYGLQNKLKTPVLPEHHVIGRPALREEYYKYSEMHGNNSRFAREPVVERFNLPGEFKPVMSVEFAGHTDVHNDLVREHKIAPGDSLYTGNLLFCEDEKGAGVMILQEAPPSSERREVLDYDFRFADSRDVVSLGWGVLTQEINPDETFVSYRNAVGIYHNAEEKNQLLKDYCRTRFNYGKERYGVVCNAWGCGKFGALLTPQFLADEVKGAAECGADSYQVDDQWQCGTLGDLCIMNKDVNIHEFWSINPEKVENGSFDSLMKLAEEQGIKLALWIAPSMTKGYRDHEEFAELILDFHRRYGFELFKIDGAYFSSYRAEQNFEKMLRQISLASGKKIFFNLDVTAGMRGGYFKLLEYGNLFLENRYACHNWGMGYHPLHTLRNAWNLAKYVRLQYIQLEVPYCCDVNDAFYKSRNVTNPNVYPWEFWFAVSFFGNPLLWFAPSTVKSEHRAIAARMTALHKKYREEIFAGTISPVGNEPGADTISGLVSRRDGKDEFMVLFRGHEAEADTFATDTAWELLAGNAEFSNGAVILPEKAGFAILKRK